MDQKKLLAFIQRAEVLGWKPSFILMQLELFLEGIRGNEVHDMTTLMLREKETRNVADERAS